MIKRNEFALNLVYRLIPILFLVLQASDAKAQNTLKTGQIDYSTWASLLKTYVDDKGFVNYKALKDNEAELLKFTAYLSKNTPTSSWTKTEKKAYYINAYNAFTLELVIKHYPVKSIKNIGSLLNSAFKKKFIPFKGELISLDAIEKDMLLPMGDARVHFAVNCASLSCPKLLNQAYWPDMLDEQLEERTKDFLSSSKNSISKSELKLSKIFKWYKSDFENEAENVVSFINNYTSTIINPEADIEYLDYNWQLNSIENAR